MLWLPENEDAHDLVVGELTRTVGAAAEFRALLKLIDDRLDLCWAKKGARSVAQDERWYIIRRSETGIGGMWMVANPDGSYSDPDERHLAALQAQDAHRHPDVWRKLRKERADLKALRQKEADARSEQFQTSLLERLDSLENTRFLVTEAHKAKLAAEKEKLDSAPSLVTVGKE